MELAKLATWFSLNQPNIDTNVCGFFNVEQLEESMQAVETGLSDHEKKILADVEEM